MIGKALRLAEPGDAVHDLALFQVDDTDAVVAELCDEQELALGVDGKVVDAARHRAQRDLRLEHRGGGSAARPAAGGSRPTKAANIVKRLISAS